MLFKKLCGRNPNKGVQMENDFRINKAFDKNPPRLKDLVNKHLMGNVWVRDTPFGPVTDSLIISKNFGIRHDKILRAIAKCREELSIHPKFGVNENFIDNSYLGGAKGKERRIKKIDITEFGLALLLLYINTPKARLISAEIIYQFFVMKSYLTGLNKDQLGALRGYYRNHQNNQENDK